MQVNIKIAIDKTKKGKKIANYLVIDGMIGDGIKLSATDAQRIISQCNLKIASAMPNSGGTITHFFQ